MRPGKDIRIKEMTNKKSAKKSPKSSSKDMRAIVITGDGTNCEMETAHACKLGGFETSEIVHISELIYGEKNLNDYHLLCLAGGFLDGDDLGSAKAGANRFRNAVIKTSGNRIIDDLLRFVGDEKLVIGICNGFQLLVKLGLIPALNEDYQTQVCTLTFNESGKFEDRWVNLLVNSSPCVFTKGIERLYLPVRHGEGRFICRDDKVLKQIIDKNLVALYYTDENYTAPTMEYPLNPNGATAAIAGICNERGNILGLMPHPEGYMHRTNHPRWTRETLDEEGMGVMIFRNAYKYCREKL